MQIISLQHLFKLSLKAIVASTETNRFDKYTLEPLSFQTHSDQSFFPRCPFLPCLDYIPAT
jgi:hypothetical protein